MSCSLVWFRRDLRVEDHPALAAAAERGEVLPVFLWTPEEEGAWAPGGASRWWLHHALADLSQQLRGLGSRLLIVDGRGRASLDLLQRVARESGADAVFWNRRYEPSAVRRDAEIKSSLRSGGLEAQSFNGSLLFEPGEISNKSGTPFKVFTPFWKHLMSEHEVPRATAGPGRLKLPEDAPEGDSLESLGLLPEIGWDSGFAPFWGGQPSRDLMEERLAGFLDGAAERYPDRRDAPAEDATSRLSPFLHFGQIGPRELWWRFADAENHSGRFDTGVMRQIVWREFAHHLLFHFPETTDRPLRPEFESFPWSADDAALDRWQRGETGYPLVDAGMRQLWQTGWMHNRVRMVVASFLVKHLLQPWQDGARWFWDTLVDADLANNTFGWQWTAGCGADAAPYFRVFNPFGQGEKFDPDGDYVRRYVPELSGLPDSHIHKPWELGELDLDSAGVKLGRDYPEPMVEHRAARERALAAFEALKN